MSESYNITAIAVDKTEGLFELFKSIQEGTLPLTMPSPSVTGGHRHKKKTSRPKTS
ncbi:MAG: hypothetical protein V3V61_02715 [Gammaproteobacteria bacterium]